MKSSIAICILYICLNSEETTQFRRMATWEKGPTTEPRTRDLRPNAEFQPREPWNRSRSFVPHRLLCASPFSHVAILLSCVVSSELQQLVPAHKEHIHIIYLIYILYILYTYIHIYILYILYTYYTYYIYIHTYIYIHIIYLIYTICILYIHTHILIYAYYISYVHILAADQSLSNYMLCTVSLRFLFMPLMSPFTCEGQDVNLHTSCYSFMHSFIQSYYSLEATLADHNGTDVRVKSDILIPIQGHPQ